MWGRYDFIVQDRRILSHQNVCTSQHHVDIDYFKVSHDAFWLHAIRLHVVHLVIMWKCVKTFDWYVTSIYLYLSFYYK